MDDRFLGPVKHLYFYRPSGLQADASPPARSFLESLPAARQAAYAKSFEKHAAGFSLRGEKHHSLDGYDDLYEYKDIESKSRLIHTTEKGQILVLLFGFTGKKENRIDQVHLNEAVRMRDEYLSRRPAIEKRLLAKTGRPKT